MTTQDRDPVLLAVGPDGDFDAALHFAAREATTRGADLVLLHAYHVLPTGPETAVIDFAPAERVASDRLRQATEHARNLVGGQVDLTTRLACGPVVRSIVDASAGCALVVLQRRSLGHLRRVVTRSTSSGVAAHAHAPVAVVPEGWNPDPQRAGTGGDVVVGVDVPARSRAVLLRAMAEARSRRARLRVLHTWWSPGYFDDIHMDRFASRSWASETTEELRAVVDALRAEGDGAGDPVAVEIETHHGRPADFLVEASRSAQLVIVGRHDPLVPLGSHLGPVARGVLRAGECPILLVSPAPADRPRRTSREERPVDAGTGP